MEVRRINLTKENLKKIKKIDDTFYKDDELTIEWYTERYNDKHQAIVLMDGDDVVGYVVPVPINKRFYRAIKDGIIVNDVYVNPKMMLNRSKYKYIISCVILDRYRHKGYGTLMIEELFKHAKGYYIALTITKDGYHTFSKYMRLVNTVNEDVHVFELKR